jgi:Taurine catabolism dioxygenase TauD, TfdA family
VIDRPLHGPAVWRGEEQAVRTDWIEPCPSALADEIEAAARHAGATGRSLGDLARSDFPGPNLPARAAAWLRELDTGRGFLLLRGLPVARWGDELSALAYVGLGLHMGTLVSQNAAGDVLGHVRDTGADPRDPSVRLYKTRDRLGFHTDGADVIGLLCLRTARHGGTSRIASSGTVFNEIRRRRSDLVPLLFEPFHFDRNEEQAPGEPPTFSLPLCHWEGDRLRTFYIGWYIRGAQRHASVPRLTDRQHELIDLIDAVAANPAVHLDMELAPGDVQLLKNAAILHARTEYEDWDEPSRKRHLLRLWVTADQGFQDGDALVRGGIPRKAGVRSDAAALAIDGDPDPD